MLLWFRLWSKDFTYINSTNLKQPCDVSTTVFCFSGEKEAQRGSVTCRRSEFQLWQSSSYSESKMALCLKEKHEECVRVTCKGESFQEWYTPAMDSERPIWLPHNTPRSTAENIRMTVMFASFCSHPGSLESHTLRERNPKWFLNDRQGLIFKC